MDHIEELIELVRPTDILSVGTAESDMRLNMFTSLIALTDLSVARYADLNIDKSKKVVVSLPLSLPA
jgi:hypothetical protein